MKYALPIILLVLVLLVSAGGFIYFNVFNAKKPVEIVIGNETIEESSKDIGSKLSIKVKRDYILNTKPQFEIGDSFKYTSKIKDLSTKKESIDYTSEYTVDSIDYINGRNYFVLTENKHWQSGGTATSKIFIDTSNGDILKMETSSPDYYYITVTTKGDAAFDTLSGNNAMFLPWMLALEDNHVISYEANRTDETGGSYSRDELTVLGKENINGRDCFKVGVKSFSRSGGFEISVDGIYWIDSYKRVLVKLQWFEDNGEVSNEINLAE